MKISNDIQKEFNLLKSEIQRIERGHDKVADFLKEDLTKTNKIENEPFVIVGDKYDIAPQKLQINIPISGEDLVTTDDEYYLDWTGQFVDTRITGTREKYAQPIVGTVDVGRDGPFIARRLRASCLIVEAPTTYWYAELPQFSMDWSHLENKFCPTSSRSLWQYWAIPNLFYEPNAPFVPLFCISKFVPPPLDFMFEYNDTGSEKERQSCPISGDILSRNDEDGYYLHHEYFEAGTTIYFTLYPLRIPYMKLMFPAYPAETYQYYITEYLSLLFKATFDGYKLYER